MSASEIRLPPVETLRLPLATSTRLKTVAIVIALIGTGLSAVSFVSDPKSFYFSYLVGFFFWLTVALGGLFFVLIHYLTRAGWSVVIRRSAEAIASTLPYFALLFVPVLLGIHQLFPWSNLNPTNTSIVAAKVGYLNVTFFCIRAIFYFAVWSFLALHTRGLSREQDYTGEASLTRRLQAISAPSILLFALTITFAGFDWVMSLDPEWYSTIFGVYIFSGSTVSIFATLALIALALRKVENVGEVITIEHTHDLGKYLFGFTVFWAYIGFSQFMLIWYANIPEETIFYQHRFHGGWESLSWMVLFGCFIIPFLLLLPRGSKRNGLALSLLAIWQLLFHLVDIFWLIAPNRSHERTVTLGDLGAVLLIGGIFAWLVIRTLTQQALIPVKDPRLAESLAFENY